MAQDDQKLRRPIVRQPIETILKERPYALMAIQTQILYDIASMLEDQGKTIIDLSENFSKTLPQGTLEPLTIPVTDRGVTLDSGNTRSMPWVTFTIYVDGPGAVYPRVNEDSTQTRTPLNMGENLTVNMKTKQIHKVILICLPGIVSSVRIFALK